MYEAEVGQGIANIPFAGDSRQAELQEYNAHARTDCVIQNNPQILAFDFGTHTHIPFVRYKTAICRNWLTGQCDFGSRCFFAHGQAELRTLKEGKLPGNSCQSNPQRNTVGDPAKYVLLGIERVELGLPSMAAPVTGQQQPCPNSAAPFQYLRAFLCCPEPLSKGAYHLVTNVG